MKNYNILITQEWKYFVAKNLDIWVVSQWEDIQEALYNIQEATLLFLEDIKEDEKISNSQHFLTTISI